MHIYFQNNKRRWCIKTETAGKHQQYISNGFTLSLQKELNTFLKELFNATWTCMTPIYHRTKKINPIV